jgi:hypothetical protein
MILLAAALTAAIQLDIDVKSVASRAEKTTSTISCNIKTVGYRFRGTPGQSFRYAGETYEIPAEGSVELLASRKSTSYTIANRSLPLDVWPHDPFGFREVPLPHAEQITDAEQITEGETR